MLVTIILLVILFVFLIFPHELGHFIAAKICDVKVNEFAFGMGPAIYQKQGDETLYSIRAVPLGGYCALEGEDTEEANDDPRSFSNKKWWQKIIILLAGAGMNVFIAFLAFCLYAGISGAATNTLSEVTPGGPADKAGIMAGDTIIAVEEIETDNWYEVYDALDASLKGEEPVELTVKRGSEVQTYTMVPELTEEGTYKIGITAGISHSPILAIKNGGSLTVNITKGLFGALKGLFQTENVLEEVSGPIGMAQVVSETRTYGGSFFLYILGIISLNLAIFNLLPFPALDGGRIIFVFIRLFTGKAISDKVESVVHTIGFAVLIFLAIIISGSDIMKLLGR